MVSKIKGKLATKNQSVLFIMVIIIIIISGNNDHIDAIIFDAINLELWYKEWKWGRI